MSQKIVPNCFVILVNSAEEPLAARNSFKNNNKKINFIFFLLNSVPFNGQDYENKRGLELVTTLQVTKQVQKKSFISDVLPDQVR